MSQSHFSSDNLHFFLDGVALPIKKRTMPEGTKVKRFTHTSGTKKGELRERVAEITNSNKSKIYNDERFYFVIEFSDNFDWTVIRHITSDLGGVLTNVYEDHFIKIAVPKENYEHFADKLEAYRKFIVNVTEPQSPVSEEFLNKLQTNERTHDVTFEVVDLSGLNYVVLLESALHQYLAEKDETISLAFSGKQFAVFSGNLSKESIKNIASNIDIIERVDELPKVSLIANVGGRTSNVGLASVISLQQPQPTSLPVACAIDSGINHNHQLLQKYISDTYDFSTNSKGPCIDAVDHGTKVGGLIVYGGNCSTHPTAISNVVMVKGFDNSGQPILKDAISMVRQTVDLFSSNVKVFNLSFAGHGPNRSLTRALDELIYRNNVSIVTCAGNIDRTEIASHLNNKASYPKFLSDHAIYFPGDSHNAITVGAITSKDSNIARKKYPSPFTRTGTNLNAIKPDVVEDGGNLEAVYQNGKIIDITHTGVGVESTTNANNYGLIEDVGTSFSTPIITSAMSSIMAHYPNISPFLAKAILLSSASKISDISKNNFHPSVQGFGLPDLGTAIFSQPWRVSYLIQGEFNGDEAKYHHYTFYFPEGADRVTITMVVGRPSFSDGYISYKTKKAGVRSTTRTKPNEITGSDKIVLSTQQSVFHVRQAGIGGWPLDITPHHTKTPGLDKSLKYGCVITVESTRNQNILSRIAGWISTVQKGRTQMLITQISEKSASS